MPTTNYYSVNGKIVGERIASGSRINYATDALGSVTGTLVGPSLQNIYAYKPYGAVLSRSGIGSDPAFAWVGTKGYRVTSRGWSETYVRARTYSQGTARWTTRDPRWPQEAAYAYLNGSPMTILDPTGLGWRQWVTCEDIIAACIVYQHIALVRRMLEIGGIYEDCMYGCTVIVYTGCTAVCESWLAIATKWSLILYALGLAKCFAAYHLCIVNKEREREGVFQGGSGTVRVKVSG